MAEIPKITSTLQEIAQNIGVSTKTVRRKMLNYKNLFQKQQRKRFYNPTEVEFIISLFHSEIKGL